MNRFFALIAVLATAASAWADTIVTVDGSRLVGEITTIDGGVVTLETSYAGTLTIDQSQIASIETAEAITVRLEDGTVASGDVSTTPAGALVVDSSAGEIAAPVSSVAHAWSAGAEDPEAVRAREAAAAAERSWAYEATVNVNGKSGNSEEQALGLGVSATLAGPDDTLNFYGSYNQAETNGEESSNELILGSSYDNFFLDHLGWYIRTELETDEYEDIDLRATGAFGLSYRWADRDDYHLSGRLGISYRHESFDVEDDQGNTILVPDREEVGLDASLRHMWQFAEWGRMHNSITYTPAFGDFGDYRLVQDSNVELPLAFSDFWNLRIGLKNEYNSEPAGGNEELDTSWYLIMVLSWD